MYAPDPRITLQWGYRRQLLRGDAVPDWLPQVHIVKHEIRLDQAAILFNGAVIWEHPTAYVDTGAGAGAYVSRPWPIITDDEQVGWGLTEWDRSFGRLLTDLAGTGGGIDVLRAIGKERSLLTFPGDPFTRAREVDR